MNLTPGQMAPDFTLYNTDKNKLSLSDLRGKNVLLLFSPGFYRCLYQELCAIRDDISRYSNVQAAVIGISVDSVFTLKRYQEDQHYNFPLLSDFNREVSALYGTLYENWILDMKGVSKRAAFIIDRSGKVQYAEVLENAGEMPDFEVINEKLDILNGHLTDI
ncbi:MAG: redoxin domain-containing protein [Chitinophagaceae bacterium]|nr:redoxin domain-containing protein [Chitinophagaceae bacterium]